MAYDEELAERIRGLLPDVPVTEQKMFGGLAFLVGGHMAVAASGKGGLMLRCDPADTERLVGEPARARWRCAARRWTAGCASPVTPWPTTTTWQRWVAVGTSYAGSLPPK